MKKEINIRQIGTLCFISTLSLKTTLLPSILHKEIGVNSILLIAIYCLIDLITFFPVYYVLKRNQNISFNTFLERSVGKIISKIIFFLISLFFMFKIFLLLEGGYTYAREVIFQEAPFLLFAYTLVICSIALYLFGLKSFARTTEFFYPAIFALMLLFLTIPFITTKIHDIRPLMDIHVGTFWKSVFKHILVSGDFIFLLLFMGKIKFNKKESIWTALRQIIYSFMFIIIFYIAFAAVFKYTGFMHPNAISELVQFVPTPSILGNFDWLTIVFVLLNFLLGGALFTFGMCDSALNCFNGKKHNQNKYKFWIATLLYIVIVITLEYFIDTFEDLAILSKDYLSYFCILIFLIPFISFIIQLIKQKKGVFYEKDN